MQTTDTFVHLTLPRNFVGQILDGLHVLTEQWDATAAYLRNGEIANEIIRDCSDVEEAESIAAFYRKIAEEVGQQLSRSRGAK